ncbi:hypothetical protein CO046_01045, partial [Candidatus Peregrinibacteria bacterium CG_4_9_14_0_2_um_filter_53_11]
RDRLDFLSDAYRASYLATGDGMWLIKERLAAPSPFVEEVVDAAVYARLGELEELSVARGGFDGTLYPARTFYREAIEHDPMNELSHYYNYGRTWLDEFGELSGEVRAELVEVMRIYTEVLSRNKHFTLLTDNPRYGSMLYGLLGMAGEKETYDAIWREEVRKYTIQFGPLPQALSPEETVGSLGR